MVRRLLHGPVVINLRIAAWLDENCGADGWAMTPSGIRGVLNDALSIYFRDATLTSAFVARWCLGAKVETVGGVFQMREDEPEPRVGAGYCGGRAHRWTLSTLGLVCGFRDNDKTVAAKP